MSSISNGIYGRIAVNGRDHVRGAQPHPRNIANTRIGGISFERGVRQAATVALTAPCASGQTFAGFGGSPTGRQQPDRRASRSPDIHAAAGPCAGQRRARTSARPCTEAGRQAFPGNKPSHRCGSRVSCGRSAAARSEHRPINARAPFSQARIQKGLSCRSRRRVAILKSVAGLCCINAPGLNPRALEGQSPACMGEEIRHNLCP